VLRSRIIFIRGTGKNSDPAPASNRQCVNLFCFKLTKINLRVGATLCMTELEKFKTVTICDIAEQELDLEQVYAYAKKETDYVERMSTIFFLR
jgi:hypothetical protein